MTRWLVWLSILFGCFLIAVAYAYAQQQRQACVGYPEMAEQLNNKYREHKFASDTTVASRMELWLGPLETKDGVPTPRTWSMLVVAPNDMTCFIAAGKDMIFHKMPPPGKEI